MRHPVTGLALTSPRAYAAAIVAEATVERQRMLFQACPFERRAQVREHVKTAQERAEKVRAHKRLVAESARKDPRPAAPDNSFRISDFKRGSPEVAAQHLAALRATLNQKRENA